MTTETVNVLKTQSKLTEHKSNKFMHIEKCFPSLLLIEGTKKHPISINDSTDQLRKVGDRWCNFAFGNLKFPKKFFKRGLKVPSA